MLVSWLAVINPRCTPPRRSAGNTCDAPGSRRPADYGLRRRDYAIDAGNRHFFPDFEAERSDDGCEQKNSDSEYHVTSPCAVEHNN